MRLHRPKRKHGCEINITPLIDIVFLLIIFSMVISQFQKIEVENLEVPEARKAEQARASSPGRIVINVDRDGRIFVSHRSLTMAGLGELLSAETRHRQPEDLTVLVRADRRTPWRNVGRVLGACAARKISQVKIAALEPESAGPKS